MINDETLIKKLLEMLETEKQTTSFENGKIVYDGKSFELSDGSKNTHKRVTNIKYR